MTDYSSARLGYRTHRATFARLALAATCAYALLMLPATPLHAQASPTPLPQLRIAAASDLQTVMPALAAAYEHATGAHLNVSYGASASLAQQIENGGPFDVFLSADYVFPEQLVAANLTDEHAPVPYARGTLVLWARKDSPLQPLSLDSLSNSRLQKLAIADELRAPYGRAAVSALRKLRVYDPLQSKLVTGSTVAQAAAFAESGNAQAALISLTIASSPHFMESGTYVRVPAEAYPEIRQCAVVLKSSPNRSLAHDFLHWLTSDVVQNNLPKHGLEPAR